MEVKLLRKETPVWIAGEALREHLQFSAESVIPDSAEDVKEIVWTKGGVLLKGKEPGLHACTVTGEAWASVLYITESGALESHRLRKEFDMSFETEASDPDALPQLCWYLNSVQARALNPRKLSVSFDVQGALHRFARGSVLTEIELPEDCPAGIHLLKKQHDALSLVTVAEKPFTVRDQLPLPADGAFPARIDGEKLRFEVLGAEQIGNRCILKGEISLELLGPGEDGMPIRSEFRLPFSQLMETVDSQAEQSCARIEPNSIYLERIEGESGTGSLDVEIHAVLQLRLYARQAQISVSDAYCSRMPLRMESEKISLIRSVEQRSAFVHAEESLTMPEDMEELLASEARLGPLERDQGMLKIPVVLELLVRSREGELTAARRGLQLFSGEIPEDALILDARIAACEIKEGKEGFWAVCDVEICWEKAEKESRDSAITLLLDEDKAWNSAQLPNLCLVRRAGEGLWTLAKEYRSSVELIRSCNAEDAELLLIPAE